MADDIGARIRAALDAANLTQSPDLLAPQAHWGAPDEPAPPCRNREQVLAWYRRGRDDATTASQARVTEVITHADKILRQHEDHRVPRQARRR